ncbi:MAG: hypothetical protein MUC96_03490 [Myxococcaceae bacterium]|jgi:hypothetical protein|nr:hypothetical protein [Myxococcaceae bacterium]
MHGVRRCVWVGLLLAGCQARLDSEYRSLCAALGGSPACPVADVRPVDAGAPDAGGVDAGVPDGSVVDAGPPCLDTMNDPLHCGACGRRCDGPCIGGQCIPMQVAPNGPVNLTRPHALWVSDGGFFVGESVFCPSAQPNDACVSNRLFEVVNGSFVLRAGGQYAISEVVLFDDRLYWNTWQEAALYVMRRDGGSPSLFHHEDAGSTFGMVVHGARLFVVRNAAPSQLLVFSLTDEGLPVRHELPDSGNGGGATMLAVCGDDAFVALNRGEGASGVAQVTRPGTPTAEVRWLLSGLDGAWAVACDDANVFVSESNANGRLLRIPRDGGAEVVVGTGLGFPRGIAIDRPFVYVIEHDAPVMRVVRYPLEGNPDAAVTLTNQVDQGIFLRRFGDHLYWTNYRGNSVVRAPLLAR